jgi:hypothetical protein
MNGRSYVALVNMLSGDRQDMCIMRYHARLANRLGVSALQREQSSMRALSTRRTAFVNPTPLIVNLTGRAP